MWQKKFTLTGLLVCAAIADSSRRMASSVRSAHGREPSAPVWDTAAASRPACTPAIGAWMMGRSIPSNCCNLIAFIDRPLPRGQVLSSGDRPCT